MEWKGADGCNQIACVEGVVDDAGEVSEVCEHTNESVTAAFVCFVLACSA